MKIVQEKDLIRISLMISTYNWKEALRAVLLSVKNQVVLPDEVIIADDGSKENVRQMIDEVKRGFPVPIVHCWHEDKGFRLSKIRNEAIKIAKYEYIILIDGDVLLPKYFIKDHRVCAQTKQFIQGARVLLSEKITKKILNTNSNKIQLPNMMDVINPLSSVKNKKNIFRNTTFSKVFSTKDKSIKKTRGCNMSFYKEDALAVNGFNEAFEGWGREDSEFATRMINAGGTRLYLKFLGQVLHLHHTINSTNRLEVNDEILDKTIAENITWCEDGIVKK